MGKLKDISYMAAGAGAMVLAGLAGKEMADIMSEIQGQDPMTYKHVWEMMPAFIKPVAVADMLAFPAIAAYAGRMISREKDCQAPKEPYEAK